MEFNQIILNFLANNEWLSNEAINWSAISTISNFFLTFTLIMVTYWYSTQAKKQTEILRIERYVKEIDLLVAPLYSKIDSPNIFRKGSSGYRYSPSPLPEVREYYEFWDEVKRYQYLGSNELRLALNNYFKNKSSKVDDKKDKEYEEAEKTLKIAIEKRYVDLEKILSNKQSFWTIFFKK